MSRLSLRLRHLLPATFAVASAAVAAPPSGVPVLSAEYARDVIFAAAPDGGTGPACDGGSDAETITCLLGARFEQDPEAARLAKDLYARSGDVVGVVPEEDFEGGYRGTIHLVPQLPIGPERKHLEWTAAALGGLDEFFAGVERDAGKKPHYRWTGLSLRFYRSVKKRTPAAFASGWTISYNVNGTLNGSAKQVRDLLFHELFHLNDRDHGDWSFATLHSTHWAIKARCGGKTACLEPYAPDPLIVHGGTYYSFNADNDVREYAADLALRYSREQRDVLAGTPVKRPFKCGPPENAKAWAALVSEFFAGVDRVPACPTPK